MYLKNSLVVLEGTDCLSFLEDGEPPKSMRLDDLIEYFTRASRDKRERGELFYAQLLAIDLQLLQALADTQSLLKACKS
jgi:hypothetical protein